MTDTIDLFAEMESDAKTVGPSDGQLRLIASLAQQQVAAEKSVADATQALKDAQAELDRIAKKELPDAMRAVGMEKFSLSDGTEISTKNEYYASISEANKSRAFGWLRDNGHEALIKSAVDLTFGKGDSEKVNKLTELLAGNGYEFRQKDSVHPQTLKAFVKEQLEKGVNIDRKAFGIFDETISKVTKKEKT